MVIKIDKLNLEFILLSKETKVQIQALWLHKPSSCSSLCIQGCPWTHHVVEDDIELLMLFFSFLNSGIAPVHHHYSIVHF